MKKQFVFISLFFLALGFSAKAQDSIHVSARLDTNQIKIGQQTQLILSASYPSGDTVIFPTLKDTVGSSKIQIVAESKPDTAFSEDNLKTMGITKTYIITSFDSGYYAIKPFKFVMGKDSIETTPLLLSVTTVPVDTSKAFKDISDIIPVHYTFLDSIIDWLKNNYIWLSAAIILLAILIYFLLRYLKKRKENRFKAPEKPKILIPPHVEALSRLNQTEEKKLWQSGKVKDYYSEITDTLRNYLERRFDMAAMEKTTDEIFDGLRLKRIEQQDKNKLYELFKLADLVKFAKETPVADENESVIKYARDFVNDTKEEIQQPQNNDTQKPNAKSNDRPVE